MEDLFQKIRSDNRVKYGTEAERVLNIIINQYSDRTHFIYEILQNAEDAEAHNIRFLLEKNRLLIFHDGRPFNENDIEGVCGIAKGTKEDGTRIGHFGIGFKSVYCYTEAPSIYSGKYHFVIKNQLFPEEIIARPGLPEKETCMILPFNKKGVSCEIAYKEIRDALLRKITADSILMLNNIETVTIEIENHPEVIEIDKQKYSYDNDCYQDNVFGLSLQTTRKNKVSGKRIETDSDYLFFTDANQEATAIIFKVDEKELKAVKNSKVYAFFPTAKEAHQNFYIHAPFDTTPARDNFKEGEEYGKHNLRLVKAIGELIWFAFIWMRDHGYLSVSGFNTVFPIYEYEEDDVLRGLYENSINIVKEEQILPTNKVNEFKAIGDIYVPLYGIIVDTFNDEDLKRLIGKDEIGWLAKEFSTEAYANVRRFLNNNFNLKTLDWKDLVQKLDAGFLKEKNLSWMERLLSRIESYCIRRKINDSHYINVSKIPFVRTARAEQICARDENGHLLVYLNNPDIAKYRIAKDFLNNEAVRSFYERALNIPEYNIEQETIENILPKYATKNVKFKTGDPVRENIEDLKVIKDAIYSNPGILDRLRDRYIVTDGNEWFKPSEVYVGSSDIRCGYNLVRDIVNIVFLSEKYFDDTVLSIRLDENFFKKIGCNFGIRVQETSQELYLRAVKKYQGVQTERKIRYNIFQKTYISKKLNWAFNYEGFPEVFQNMTKEKSLAIARFLNPNAMNFDIKGEIVGADDQHFTGKNVSSAVAYTMLGMILSYEEWIYTKLDDKPHRPVEVDRDDILDEYRVAKRLISILPFKEVKNAFTEWLEANISNPSDVDQIKHYLSKPEDLVKIAKAIAKKEASKEARRGKGKSIRDMIEAGDQKQTGSGKSDDDIVVSPISEQGKEKREKNLDKELAASLDNFTSVSRSLKGLQFSSRTSNQEERQFLLQEYDGHCQICCKQINKYNGERYFEAINVIKFSRMKEKLENSSRYGWNSLCLCPNCAAEYNYSSKKISAIYDQVVAAEVKPGSDETINIEIELPEGKQKYIRYTPRHFMALKEALKLFSEEE